MAPQYERGWDGEVEEGFDSLKFTFRAEAQNLWLPQAVVHIHELQKRCVESQGPSAGQGLVSCLSFPSVKGTWIVTCCLLRAGA